MRQTAFAFAEAADRPSPRVVVGNANADAVAAFAQAARWPFGTAILAGPPRSGKSLLARWFVDRGPGDAIDDADTLDEAEVFHAWNRAQASGRPLLLVQARERAWRPTLPDLASRLGAARALAIGAPDDAMLGELIALHAERRGLALGAEAAAYLVPRCERSHVAVERLVGAIDRLSLERQAPPTLAVWREAIAELAGAPADDARQPRLL